MRARGSRGSRMGPPYRGEATTDLTERLRADANAAAWQDAVTLACRYQAERDEARADLLAARRQVEGLAVQVHALTAERIEGTTP